MHDDASSNYSIHAGIINLSTVIGSEAWITMYGWARNRSTLGPRTCSIRVSAHNFLAFNNLYVSSSRLCLLMGGVISYCTNMSSL